MKKLFLYLLILSVCQTSFAQQIPLIPLPNQYQRQEGSFTINKNTPILAGDPASRAQATFLQKELLKRTGITVSIQSESNLPPIILNKTKGKVKQEEEYSLQMSPESVKISSKTDKGLFYGIISLLQLVQSQTKGASAAIDCWNIKNDAPKYSWRGLMLDESRHFFGKETVKLILDQMAYYKLNRFHWHLTDVQGWRLEINQYPKLALIGGIGNNSNPFAPAAYYTQEDIKEIISYANERFITVIPEIDMPGHAAAANKAYPGFSGGGSEKYPDFTFNPGKEATYQYLTNILRETDALFPSEMIHLGGDEVSFGSENWNRDSSVQSLMQRHNLGDLKSVEQYFVRRMADSVFKLNNKALFWDEAAGSTLPANKTLIFWWRHDKPEQLKLALDKGFPVVLCPRLPFYFDFVQDSTDRAGRRWGGKFNSLDKVYDFSTDTLAPQGKSKQILGVQAALWTERVPAVDKLEYMLFPRICALAETAWTEDENKDYLQFMDRLKASLNLFRTSGIYFYNPFSPRENPEPVMPQKKRNF